MSLTSCYDRALCIVRNEVSNHITSMRKMSTSRWGTASNFRTLEEEPDQFLKNFYDLRCELSQASCIESLDCINILRPFVETVKHESVTGHLTGLALLAIQKFIRYEIFNIRSVGIEDAVEKLAHVVTHTRFQGSDPSKDEVVLLEILIVLKELLLSPLGALLTNESVCECLQSCFRICFEMRLSDLLRKNAGYVLEEMIQRLFSRLREFSQEIHSESDHEVTLQRENMSDTTSYTGGETDESYTTEEPSKNVIDDEKIDDTNAATSMHFKNNDTDAEIGEQTTNEVDPPPYCAEVTPSDLEISTSNASLETSEPVNSDIADKERVASLPYGLPCIREALRFLSTLINPFDRRNSLQMLKIGVSLTKVAIEWLPNDLDKFPSIVKLLQDHVCKYSVYLLRHDNLQLFASALQNCFLLFTLHPHFLKLQLELFLSKLMEMVTSEKTVYAKKEIIMECLVSMLDMPNFTRDLFLNYDFNLYRQNLFEDLIHFLSKVAFPNNGLYTIHICCVDGLLNVAKFINNENIFPNLSNRNVNNQATQEELISSPQVSEQEASHLSRILTAEEALSARTKKKELLTGSKKFNVKPTEGIDYFIAHDIISQPPQSIEVATLLKKNIWLNKKLVGEYLCDKKNEHIFLEYIKLFDFNGVSLVGSLREFNESFRISGEAPVIQRVMEIFADYWLEENETGIGCVFANVDAVFVLAYAILMLNTDQHNPEVKNPMTFEELVKIQRNLNGDKNFPKELLKSIYTEIKENEIVIPEERGGIILDEYLWKIASRQSTTPEGQYFSAATTLYDKDIFGLLWRPIVSMLSYIFENGMTEDVILKSINGLKLLASVSTHFNQSFILDKIITTICKFTYMLSPIESFDDFAILFGSSPHAKIVTLALFEICSVHGNFIRESWRDTMNCLLRLYCARLLPTELLSIEDYLTPDDVTCKKLTYKETETGKQDGSIISSILSLMTTETLTRQANANEIKAREAAEECIRNCNLEKLFQGTKYIGLVSLQELIKVLINGSTLSEDDNQQTDEESAILFLELLVKITIFNRDRASNFWQELETHLFTLILNGQHYLRLCERAVVSLIQIINSLFSMGSMSERALQSLKIFLCISQSLLNKISLQILAGLKRIISTRHLLVRRVHDWSVIFAIIELAGTGCCPALTQFRNELARTESDSARISQKLLQVPWEFSLNPKELILCPISVKFSAIPEAYVEAITLLTSLLEDHCTILSVTNILAYIHAVRSFAEIAQQFPGDEQISRSSESNTSPNIYSKSFWETEQSKCLDLLTLTFSHVHEICTEIPLDELQAKADGFQNDLKRISWNKGYSPLFQGISYIAVSRNQPLRQSAFTALQKNLLSPYLNNMPPQNWVNCFEKVFFPLLDYLLKIDRSFDHTSLEEIRTRSITIVSKVFLQQLSVLHSLSTFIDLWTKILVYMREFMTLKNSDMLCEAIPECLKNMLLVMKTADIFNNNSVSANFKSLWEITCENINAFLPNLIHDLFPDEKQAKNSISGLSPLTEASHSSLISLDQVIILQPPLPPTNSPEINNLTGDVQSNNISPYKTQVESPASSTGTVSGLN